jgi:hypothetical protein
MNTPTPETDKIFNTLALANHPETDGEHFRAFMEQARNGVESMEQHLTVARDALDKIAAPATAGKFQQAIARKALSIIGHKP